MARSTKGLYKRGNIWWMTYRDASGKQRFYSCKTSRKEEANYHLTCRRKEAMEGILPPAKIAPVSLDQLSERYLAWANTQRGVRTKRFHFAHLKRHLENPPIHAVTVAILDRYREKRQAEGVGPATINREMATLKHALTMAVRWKLIRSHVREDLAGLGKLKEPSGRLRYLSGPAEAERLIQQCRDVLKPIVITALYTGMRKGEVLGLIWDAVDLRHGFIHLDQTKNGTRRTVPLNNTVQSILKGLRSRIDVPWVFHDHDGNRITDVQHHFTKACQRAGLINFHFHDLRHTFASWLIMKGVDLVTVKELLGHKSLGMTLRYSHLSPTHTAAAVRVLDGPTTAALDDHFTNEGFPIASASPPQSALRA